MSDSYQDCLNYIEQYWDKIVVEGESDRQTLIGLPHPYLVPNRDIFEECYYWDSYFITRAFIRTEREKLIVSVTDNFLHLIERFGIIPNANRFYHLSRSQPPYLSSLVRDSFEVVKETRGDTLAHEWLASAYALVCEEYREVWCGTSFQNNRNVYQGLSRYYDVNVWHHAAEAESGWDMTTRFHDKCLDFLPIDLNSLLYRYEQDLEQIALVLGKDEDAKDWNNRAKQRYERINELFWNPHRGSYVDFDYVEEAQGDMLTAGMFSALWAGVASEERAAEMVERALPALEYEHGVVTTENFSPVESDYRQWAWPNGWAPLHFMCVSGLERYGFHVEAGRIARKWVDLITKIYTETGVIYEKYDVVEGKRAASERYPDQTGFGWTNAIYKVFYEKYF